MGHTHIKTTETSRSCDHYNRQDKKITDPVSTRILLHIHPKKFPEGDKNGNLIICPGLNNKPFLKHLTPSFETALGHMYQETNNPQ